VTQRTDRLSDRQLWGIGWVLSLVVALFVAHGVTGFPFETGYGHAIASGNTVDVLFERASAWEALFGDPYRPLGKIMAEHGYPAIEGDVAVRTPAAFLLQLPLLLVPESILLTVAVSTVLLLLAIALKLTFIVSDLHPRTLAWLGPVFFISFPAVTAILFGTVTVLVPVVLILLCWAFRDKPWAGIPLGIATASRLWPALIIVGLWVSGRKKSAALAATTFVVLSVAGLALPGVTFDGTWVGLADRGASWMAHPQNSSLAHVLAPLGVEIWLPVLVVSAIGLFLAMRRRQESIDITTIAALIASPLSWPAYAISGLPALTNLIGRVPPVVLALIAFPWVGWLLLPNAWRGYAMFLSLVCLLVTVALKREPEQNE
jgi:Glycosyltransferase family 87